MSLVALGLTSLLVLDLTRNLRTVVIGEACRMLENAAKELLQTAQNRHLEDSNDNQKLKTISYEVLRSYLDVEGGFLWGDTVVGHTFPSYTEPGTHLRQPALEHRLVLEARDESRRTGKLAGRTVQDGRDVVAVEVLSSPHSELSSWTIRRIINFSDSSELNKRILLVGVMLFALLALGIVLRFSFSLQRGFSLLQSGLEQLRSHPEYRLPDQNHELKPIVDAVNAMAESRQTIEAELRREDRLRVMGRMVAGIAHEIRNPLNSMRLNARLLERRLKDQQEAREPVQLVIGEIDRLDTLLKSLLAFRPDEPVALRRQLVGPILERTLALVAPHAKESGVEIIISPAVAGHPVLVDAHFLQQALINVILNAIDASKGRGPVTLDMAQTSKGLQIDIYDRGPGLLPEQEDRVFEAFYTTKPNGTGLGLAVTRTLLEKMGAQITGQNTDQGTRFRIFIPAEEPSH